jgi:hypothetical protein
MFLFELYLFCCVMSIILMKLVGLDARLSRFDVILIILVCLLSHLRYFYVCYCLGLFYGL